MPNVYCFLTKKYQKYDKYKTEKFINVSISSLYDMIISFLTCLEFNWTTHLHIMYTAFYNIIYK